jgi:drug/metabolite transporter (DMT)-like permease
MIKYKKAQSYPRDIRQILYFLIQFFMWLFAALSSYFINAGVYVADKFLLSKKIHSSVVYAFYVGIWSIFNAVILIFDPWVPAWNELIIDLSAGLLFLFTLVFWYKTLHQCEATRVVPIVGALIPIFSLVLSSMYLDEPLNKEHFIAFFVLISGGALISIKHTKFYRFKQVVSRLEYLWGKFKGDISAESRPIERLIVNSAISAFFFAAFYVLMKYIYLNQPFIGSFVWSRFGTFIGSIAILAVPSWRAGIKDYRNDAKKPKNLVFFISVCLAAGLAFILLNRAISLGNVAMVNALQGTQFLFLILIVLIVSARWPDILEEEVGKSVILQKFIGIILVSLGLWMLA